ncbi:FkbM family methyltransferase [Roseomonas sp. NAR14]|uniref:FkbM family methyltransferase n=1 Tax=Roseomonas acroporae TaxID=2937791 RepID=A0A9X1Y6D5_9PROT|nr:FkbM family methyltransferase [Roseomonas acroporae]MCK8783910.1 FkbM family methyltransferase [Roseomonas acroporae]
MDQSARAVEAVLRRRLAAIEEQLARIAARVESLADGVRPAATYMGGQVVLTRLRGGLLIFLDTRSTDFTPHVATGGDWEPGITAAWLGLLNPGDTVLDVGAHMGFHTLLSAAAVGAGGQVHGIEPNESLSRLAQRSITANGLDGIARLHTVAAGDAVRDMELIVDPAWSGAGVVLPVAMVTPAGGQISQPCRMAPLDGLFPADFRVDAIKLSVQGAELAALKGLRGMIERSPDVRIAVRVQPDGMRLHGETVAALAEYARSLGFRFWFVGGDGSLHPTTAEAVAGLPGGQYPMVLSRRSVV